MRKNKEKKVYGQFNEKSLICDKKRMKRPKKNEREEEEKKKDG